MDKPIRVLCLGDSPLGRGLARDALMGGQTGFAVTEAASRQELDASLDRDTYDVILSEYNVAGFHGIEVLKAVQAKAPHVPVIIVTGKGSEEAAGELLKEGVAACIVKAPQQIAGLPSAIHTALEAQRLRRDPGPPPEAHTPAEQEIRQLKDRLLQAQRTQALGTLAGGVVHDFNNILTAIQGYADLALMKTGRSTRLYKDLKNVRQCAVRAAGLVRQLLVFSRGTTAELVPVRLNKIVQNLLKMLRHLIPEDIALRALLSPRLWTVQADTVSIEQIVMNLVVNARDAMPHGGTITIRTEKAALRADDCRAMAGARPGRFVRLSVADTGAGVPEQVLPRIFDPFFTTKEEGRGTGLGLTIVQEHVRQHGGWIHVVSGAGQGTTFAVYLPAVSGAQPGTTRPLALTQRPHGSGEKILIIEDDPRLRDSTAKALQAHGYRVVAVGSAAEAMDRFTRDQDEIRLVLADVVLPDGNALETVERMRALRPGLRVLLSSGHADAKSRRAAAQERALRFLQKPYAVPALLQAVKGALR